LLIRWLKLSIKVGVDELRIDGGLLNRTSRAIPFDRVTDVDIEQGPLNGVAVSPRSNSKPGIGRRQKRRCAHTSLDRAEALREHIRAQRLAATVAVAAGRAPARRGYHARLTAGLFNFSLDYHGLFGIAGWATP
jgi:putative membrane protein